MLLTLATRKLNLELRETKSSSFLFHLREQGQDEKHLLWVHRTNVYVNHSAYLLCFFHLKFNG